MQRLFVVAGVALAIFFVVSEPQDAADLVLVILELLGTAASGVVEFVRALIPPR